MTLRASDFPIVRPCDQRWERMTASAHGRHCGQCDTDVLDLSRLSEPEARRVLANGDACIRYEVREDGSLITASGSVLPVSRLFAKVKPVLVAASTFLVPACGDAPREPIPVAASAQPAPAVQPRAAPAVKTDAPAAACDVPALSTSPSTDTSDQDAGPRERRPRRVVMGRYQRPAAPNVGSGANPLFEENPY